MVVSKHLRGDAASRGEGRCTSRSERKQLNIIRIGKKGCSIRVLRFSSIFFYGDYAIDIASSMRSNASQVPLSQSILRKHQR